MDQPNPTWDPEQQVAIDKVRSWLYDPAKNPWFYLAGFAGTGKTTLAKYLASGVSNAVFAAYTGKAAQVLRSKGCTDASTIHKLIYRPNKNKHDLLNQATRNLDIAVRDDDVLAARSARDAIDTVLVEDYAADLNDADRPSFSLLPKVFLQHVGLIVLDEVSMVNERMGQDLLQFGVPLLVLGDPGQLQPIEGGGYFTNRKPDIQLSQIHRQAQGNPILDLATLARCGQELTPGTYGSSSVLEPRGLTTDRIMAADIVLAGKNVERRRINELVRKNLGRKHGYPVKGDRVICLTNMAQQGLFNGTMLEVVRDAEPDPACDLNIVMTALNLDTGNHMWLRASTEAFIQYVDPDYRDGRTYWERVNTQTIGLDYAYCLTTHKAQGSQWDNVLVADDGFGRWKNDDTRKRWVYTAITRAASSVTYVLDRVTKPAPVRPARPKSAFGGWV